MLANLVGKDESLKAKSNAELNKFIIRICKKSASIHSYLISENNLESKQIKSTS